MCGLLDAQEYVGLFKTPRDSCHSSAFSFKLLSQSVVCTHCSLLPQVPVKLRNTQTSSGKSKRGLPENLQTGKIRAIFQKYDFKEIQTPFCPLW